MKIAIMTLFTGAVVLGLGLFALGILLVLAAYWDSKNEDLRD